ncbi:MAG: hypothetical protein IPQ00_07150 [Chloracidobacterium sp.]|nr:hypothetical protein [Chloracidobacterium sp.]
MYANRLGRFSSIDFENAGALDIEPQSWNAYSYSLNNPVNITDPSGLQWVTKDGEELRNGSKMMYIIVQKVKRPMVQIIKWVA